MLVKCNPNGDTNAIKVQVSYVKGSGIHALAMPAQWRNGIVTVNLREAAHSPEIILAAIKRNNTKLVFVCESQIKADLDRRSGPGWELVLACCQANGLTPLEHEPAPCS